MPDSVPFSSSSIVFPLDWNVDIIFETLADLNPNFLRFEASGGYNENDVTFDIWVNPIRLHDSSGAAIPTIINLNEVDLVRAVPDMNFGDLVKTVDGCKAVAEKLNKAGELLKKEGLKFAYHNHAWEWTKVGDTSFYDVLLKETDVNLVKLEMDIYWVVRAGLDPVAMLEQHPGKFELFHVKDADKNNINLNTEIGKGSIDFKAIFAKAKKAGVKHFIVEQENFTNIDPYVSIAQSSAYVKNNLSI
ncbi:MAG: hypothetical protein EOP51_23925 [Sphingobacteriales bacterium]|nr:MAG: hypothetical protein EOP51_23925 [Sphingobacteriales bacterium]